MSLLLRRVARATRASPSRLGMPSPAYPHLGGLERPTWILPIDLDDTRRAGRILPGLRKLSQSPSQTHDFAGATSRARPVRHCETPIRNLEAGIGQDDI